MAKSQIVFGEVGGGEELEVISTNENAPFTLNASGGTKTISGLSKVPKRAYLGMAWIYSGNTYVGLVVLDLVNQTILENAGNSTPYTNFSDFISSVTNDSVTVRNGASSVRNYAIAIYG